MKFYCGGQKVKIESWARELGLIMLLFAHTINL